MANELDAGIFIDDRTRYAQDERLRRVPFLVRTTIKRELGAGIEQAFNWMIDERLSGGPQTGRTTSLRIARRTGRLIASMKRDVIETEEGVFLGAIWQGGDDVIRMIGKALHWGAHIVPRVAEWLTVPIAEEARGRRARTFRTAFVLRARDGRLFIAQRAGKDRLLILYRLMKEVFLPSRPFMSDTAKLWWPRITKRLRDALSHMAEGW